MLSWSISAGPLISEKAANNKLILCLLGTVVAFLFMEATLAGYQAYGRLWTAKTVGFCVSTLVFTFLTWTFLGEVPTLKDCICLGLAALILIVRVI